MHDRSLAQEVPARLSSSGHEASHPCHPLEMRSFGLGFGPGSLTPPAPRAWDRLFFSRNGAAVARWSGGSAILREDVGLHVRSEIAVELVVRGRTDVRVLFSAAATPRAIRSVVISPLLRELVERLVTRGYLDPNYPSDLRLLAVMHDEIAELREAPFALAAPHDPRACAAIEWWESGERDAVSVRAIARAVRTAARTLERIFTRETGFGVAAWFRRRRLMDAACAVADGARVIDVAYDHGYATPSGFTAAFRHAFGVAPSRLRPAFSEAPIAGVPHR